MLSAETIELFTEQFRERRPMYADLARKLAELITELLVQEKIDAVSVDHRPKKIDSFVEKMQRQGKSYKDPLTEITDLSALRIIAYTNDEVRRIGKIIEQQFTVTESVERGGLLDADRFGYRSLHYIVTLDGARVRMPEWRRFEEVKSEIQIRTVLQHAWAAIDHRLRYKNSIDIPKDVKRRLFRISALLECSDDEFSWVIGEIDRVRKLYEDQFRRGELSAEVNRESVEIFINDARFNNKLVEAAKESGFHIGPLPENSKDPYVNLLRTIESAGIKTISELEALVVAFDETAYQQLSALHDKWAKHSIVQVLNANLPTLFRIVIALQKKDKRVEILATVPFGEVLQNAFSSIDNDQNITSAD